MLFYLTGTFSSERLAHSSWNRFFLNGWDFDRLYLGLFVWPFKTVAKLNKSDTVDGPYLATAWLSREFHRLASASQTGRVRWYASSMALGAVIFIAIGLLS